VKIAVIGAGIAGLAAAARLSEKHDVTVLEREATPGGKIRSQHIDGYCFEWGPNGFLSSAGSVLALVHEIGLEPELVTADAAAAKRSIYFDGALHALPAKPQQALAMSLLSPLGKGRALRELFAKPPRQVPPSESVADFFARHFGHEVAERIVAPALLGISGGDARQTSVDALFPRLRELEREHGSVLRGLMRAAGGKTTLLGFGASGMQRLTDALAEKLGERITFGADVERIVPDAGGWRIDDGGRLHRADAVIVTTPADIAARALEAADAELATQLRRIGYSSMRVAAVAYRAPDVPVPLDGFGFLAARGQGVRILGALYSSTMFPQQAPSGVAYLRVFLGGATDPQAVALDTATARAIVRADLERTLRIVAEPIAYHEALWPRAIPQYNLDHPRIVAAIETRRAMHAGLFLTGNAYRGIGVGDTVRDALAVAAAVA
jgi:oxygen-dependent protoporphyrinogen oxidase